jgi:AraC-like DNA-binding protein
MIRILKKIKRAKEIIIERMSEPPTLNNLSNEVDISLKNLKEGFKKVYGNTVFGYLYEHKMNVASQLLTSKNYNVNEVALHLGYSTSSHFINAFKNKFGTTPKKYLNSN